MDRVLYLRDDLTGEQIMVFLYDNKDGTHMLHARLRPDTKLPVLDPSAKPAPPTKRRGRPRREA